MKQQTNWMYPNRVYVVSGSASSNSLLFEDEQCNKVFFKYFNRFVSPMVSILHYKLYATEWAILIKTGSEEEIRNAYLSQRALSKTADRNMDHDEVFRMLSEHFRMFLSNFVRGCNIHLKRKGSVVMKRFDKQLVSTEMNYYLEFERICDLKFCTYQQIKDKYQAKKELYDSDEMKLGVVEVPNILQSSFGVYLRKVQLEQLPVKVKIVRPFSHVLREILSNRKIKPNQDKPPP